MHGKHRPFLCTSQEALCILPEASRLYEALQRFWRTIQGSQGKNSKRQGKKTLIFDKNVLFSHSLPSPVPFPGRETKNAPRLLTGHGFFRLHRSSMPRRYVARDASSVPRPEFHAVAGVFHPHLALSSAREAFLPPAAVPATGSAGGARLSGVSVRHETLRKKGGVPFFQRGAPVLFLFS